MKPTKNEIGKQLWKEFWLPITIAIIWLGTNMIFSLSKTDSEAIKYINVFGTGFFFFSYLTGHYNRVKKQLTVEKNLNTVERNIIHLTEQLDKKTDHLINYMTGGDSYFYYVLDHNIAPDNFFKLKVVYVGDYPLNDVGIWFPFKDTNFEEHKIELKSINMESVGRAGCDLKLQFNDTNSCMTSIIFNANNKSWVQILYVDKKDFDISVRSEIYIDKNLIHQETYPSFVYDWNRSGTN